VFPYPMYKSDNNNGGIGIPPCEYQIQNVGRVSISDLTTLKPSEVRWLRKVFFCIYFFAFPWAATASAAFRTISSSPR